MAENGGGFGGQVLGALGGGLGGLGAGVLGNIISGLFRESDEEKRNRDAVASSNVNAAGSETSFDQFLAKLATTDPTNALDNFVKAQNRAGILNLPRRDGSRPQAGSDMGDIIAALRNPNTFGLSRNEQGGFDYTPPNFQATTLNEDGSRNRGQGTDPRSFIPNNAPPAPPPPVVQPDRDQQLAQFLGGAGS